MNDFLWEKKVGKNERRSGIRKSHVRGPF